MTGTAGPIVGSGLGVSGGTFLQVSDADYIEELGGPFNVKGGSIGAPGGVGGEYFSGESVCGGTVKGVSVGPIANAGTSRVSGTPIVVPATWYVGRTYTGTYPRWTPAPCGETGK